MKQIITNYRYWVLFAIATLIVVTLFGMPQDSFGFFAYITVFFAMKAIAAVALIAFYTLYIQWESEDKIPELTKFINEND